MKFKSNQLKTAGYSFVEVLVAIAILLIGIVGPLTIASKGLHNAYFAREQNIAFFLAQEGIESIQYFQHLYALEDLDSGNNGETTWDWIDNHIPTECLSEGEACGFLSDDNFIFVCGSSSSDCQLSFNDNGSRFPYRHEIGSENETIYKREIFFDQISDDSIRVRSVVSWAAGSVGGSTKTVELEANLFNYYKNYLDDPEPAVFEYDSDIIFLTSGSSWTVPSDWNSTNNKIEVIGGGGGGAVYSDDYGHGGGGGGAYSTISNLSLTPGESVEYSIGGGGASGSDGGDTYFNGSSLSVSSVGAVGGSAGFEYDGGAGGPSASSVGTTKYSGGDGGDAVGWAGTGGGAAAGPSGTGGDGGTVGSGAQGGSGGGGSGGSNGSSGSSFSGGDGGGVGGGDGATSSSVDGANGTSGGGGGGGYGSSTHTDGGNGGAGIDWDSTHGAGGGGGGGGDTSSQESGVSGNGGNYGGGGGGVSADPGSTAGSGAQGIIIIRYIPL